MAASRGSTASSTRSRTALFTMRRSWLRTRPASSSARSDAPRRRREKTKTMKTLLKIVGVLVVVVLVAAAAGVGYLYAAYPNVELAEYRIEATPDRLARGRYLTDHVVGCTTCHTQRDW